MRLPVATTAGSGRHGFGGVSNRTASPRTKLTSTAGTTR
jgi:hypothetical protein